MTGAPAGGWRTWSGWRHVVRLGMILALVAGAYTTLKSLNWSAFSQAFREAQAWPLVLAAALNFILMGCKALAWRSLLLPEYVVSAPRLMRYTLIAMGVSAVAPMRAGEALRVWILKTRDEVPLARSISVAALEKILDVVSMLLVVAPLPWLLPGLPPWILRSLELACLGTCVGWVVLWAVARRLRGRTRALPQWLARIQTALQPLTQPTRHLWAAAGVLAFSWVVDLWMVWLVLSAVHIHLPWAASLLILLFLNMAIALPSTPGQVGALEVGALTALNVFAVDPAQGAAFAVLYHVAQLLPLLLVTLVDLRFVLAIRRSKSRSPQSPPIAASGA